MITLQIYVVFDPHINKALKKVLNEDLAGEDSQ